MNNLIEYFKTSECDNEEQPNNQLFSKKYPPFDLVRKVVSLLTNTTILTNDIHYEFTLKLMTEKKIIERIEPYIIELKQYYLKCKHEKYLENLNEKKVVTILRQILRPYDYTIKTYEKYNNGKKYLLYILFKDKGSKLKKINSIISFD